MIEAKVAAVRAEREKAIARRKDALTGTSEFPDIAEVPAAVLDIAPASASRAVSGTALPASASPNRSKRCAMPPTAPGQSGAGPKIFLANLGPLADFTARATYAKNFFEAGGIEAVTNDGFASRDEMAAAFKASGAALACLCSSDDGLRRRS